MYTSIAAYHFVVVDDPAAVVVRIRAWAEAQDLLGTVLVADEGINLFLAGSEAGIGAFLALLRGDARFAGLQAKVSYSHTQPFARLKVKHKPEIISFRRDGVSPLEGRAPAVAPVDLARWIARGRDDDGRRLVLLDTRNREEVGHGTFAGALTLPIDNFTDLPAALEPHREALADATVVGFCTGGIRCEKAVRWMRDAGFGNALQLDGGILGYFEATGGAGYEGRCFVFDERIALDPGLRAAADDATTLA
ncbi:sulfurtransferase [Luteimonas sp. MJ174]|uniref:sulfurtransferase n=1 Tax=Luteimonas sp. MJ174 TaxID=3129237 RepID=UPI0031BBC25C